MSGWIFATGRALERDPAVETLAGEKSFPIDGRDFVPGDLLFIARTPATPRRDVQWLGRVEATNDDELAFSLRLSHTLPSSTALFRAAQWIELQATGAWHGAVELNTGLAQAASPAGDTYTLNLASPMQHAELRLDGLTTETLRAFRAWVIAHLGSGAEPFALIAPDFHLWHARLTPDAHGRLAFRWVPQPGAKWQLQLPLTLLGEEVYP